MEPLGFTASGQPLDHYPGIDWSQYVLIGELGRHPIRRVRSCKVILAECSLRQTVGRWMKFLTHADRTGMVETELFADAYRCSGAVTTQQPVVAVSGRIEPFANGNGFTLRVARVEKPKVRFSERMEMNVHAPATTSS